MTAEGAAREAIIAHLEANEISQRELARRLGWGRMQVNRRLSGSAQITVDELHELSRALNVPVSTFLETASTGDPRGPEPAAETGDQTDRSAKADLPGAGAQQEQRVTR